MSGLNKFLMHEVEMPLVSVVADMEETGYPVDVEFFRNLRGRVEPEIEKVRKSIQKDAEKLGVADLNPKSPKQLAVLLYDVMEIEPTKWTEGDNPSTDKQTLERLASEHKIIADILRFRDLDKTLSTYCKIPGSVSEDGRFRANFNQLAAETGRFSSSSIIQTLPKNDEFSIRKGFRARDGYDIVGGDFEQQELNVLAQQSGDKNMLTAIAKKDDLHGLATVKVFKLTCEPKEVKKKHPDLRDRIKAIQFGLIYGRSARSLAEELNISLEEAEQLIADYFKQFPAVQKFISKVHTALLRDGYIDDVFGRRRHFPEVKVKVARKQYHQRTAEEKEILSRINAAKRQAQNFVIQGASATITKLAMLRCHQHVTAKYGELVRMILTLHDELQFEAKKEVVSEFAAELPELMCNLGLERFGFKVPLTVDVKHGPSWGEMTQWKKESQDGNHSRS